MPPLKTRNRNESDSSLQPLLLKSTPSPSFELCHHHQHHHQQLHRASQDNNHSFHLSARSFLPSTNSTRLPILPPPLPIAPLQSSTRSCSSFGLETDTEPSSCCTSPVRPLHSSTPGLAKPQSANSNPDWFVRLGKEKHHPYDPREVPYWLSYEPEVIDHHILMMYASSPQPFKLLGAPPAGPFTVLDLGCGPTAPWSVGALAANPHRASFTALDICPLLLPRPLPSKLTFIQHDFLNALLPFPDNSFNHVHVSFIASAVPEHQYAELLEEIKRVLKPQGALDILETNAIPNSVLEERLLTPYPLSILPAQLAMLGLARLERHQVKGHRALLSITRRAALNASRAWCDERNSAQGKKAGGNLASLLGERFGWYGATDESDALKSQDQSDPCSGLLDICQSRLTQPHQSFYTSAVGLVDGARHEHLGSFDLETRREAKLTSVIQTVKADLISVSGRLEGAHDVLEGDASLTIESIIAYKID